MYDDLKEDVKQLITMIQSGEHSEVEILEQRVNILENIIFHMLTRQRASLLNDQRTRSNYERELAQLLDGLKSEIMVNSGREQKDTTTR